MDCINNKTTYPLMQIWWDLCMKFRELNIFVGIFWRNRGTWVNIKQDFYFLQNINLRYIVGVNVDAL